MSANTPAVTEMQVIPVAGYDSMEMTLGGAHTPYFARNLAIIKDSSGHTDIGEIRGRDYTYECLTSRIPLIVGQEVDEYRSILGCIHRDGKQATGDNGESIRTLDISKLKFTIKAEQAVECALLNLLGQHLGIPVCELLAEGKQRDQVEVLGYLFYVSDKNKTDLPYLDESQSRSPQFRVRRQKVVSYKQITKQVCCLQDKYGYRGFRLKDGVFSGDYEMDTVRALKKQFPQGRINIDPNGAWNLEGAIRLCRDMGNILSYIENPCGPEAGFSGREIMTEFKDATKLLAAISMIATNWRRFYHVTVLKAVDIVLTDPYFWGLEESPHMATLLSDWGLTWGSRSSNYFDITLTTSAHVAAAASGSPTALDIHWIWQGSQNLLRGTPVIKSGYLEAPDRPRLGVALDMDQVMEADKLYNHIPGYDRDDAMAMQHLIPGQAYDSRKSCLVRQETL